MSYGNFDELVGKLHRSAIDAWMVSNNEYWNIRGDVYEISSRSTKTTVTRPGNDGKGGGDWSGDFGWLFGQDARQDEQYTAGFAAVRESINKIVDPWKDIPDPANIAPYVETCRSVTTRLSSSGWSDGKNQRPAGVALHSQLSAILEDSSAIKGVTGDSFRTNFLGSLGLVVDGLLGISLLRGGAMSSQEGLWEAAREDVLSIFAEAIKTFDAIAARDTAAFKHKLGVVEWALKGLNIFAPGLVSKGIDVLLWEPEYPSDAPTEVTSSASTYEEACEAFSKSLKALSDRIRTEERTISNLLSENRKVFRMSDYRGNYDLQPPQLTEENTSGSGMISLDPVEDVQSIANSFLPAVSVELDEVAGLNHSCSDAAAVTREWGIGLGSTGPSTQVKLTNDLLHNLLEDLAAETLEGAVQLKQVLTDFQETEDAIIAELNQYLAQTQGGGNTHFNEELDNDLLNVVEDRKVDPLYPFSERSLQNLMSNSGDEDG